MDHRKIYRLVYIWILLFVFFVHLGIFWQNIVFQHISVWERINLTDILFICNSNAKARKPVISLYALPPKISAQRKGMYITNKSEVEPRFKLNHTHSLSRPLLLSDCVEKMEWTLNIHQAVEWTSMNMCIQMWKRESGFEWMRKRYRWQLSNQSLYKKGKQQKERFQERRSVQ